MSIQVKKNTEITCNRWAAGTTSELYIWPSHANFIARDFDFRISTATVEQAETTFTKFEGYSRELLILAGELKIHHENLYSKTLQVFDVDSFEGDWNTKAEGMVSDFNIIYRGKVLAKLDAVTLQTQEQHAEQVVSPGSLTLIYIWQGEVTFANHTGTNKLTKGDCIILNYDDAPETIQFLCLENAALIMARIWY